MKKVLLALAALTMTVSVYAADAKPEAKATTTWDFTGTNVEYKHTFVDTDKKTNYSGKDVDLILQVKKDLDPSTWISFKYDTDDSNPDDVVEVLVNRKFGKYIEAQLDMNLVLGHEKANNDPNDGINLEEDSDSSKSFIKYQATDNLNIKFAPFDIDFSMGTEFATDDHPVIPGIELDYTVSDKMSVYAGLGSKALGQDDTVYGYKFGFAYTASDKLNMTGAFSTATKDCATANTAANFTLGYKAGKVGFNFETLYVGLNKGNFGLTDDENGTGIFAKLSYDAGKTMKDVKTSPYVSVKNFSKYFYFDDSDDSFQNYKSLKNPEGHGGLTSLAAGIDFTTSKGLTVTPELEYRTAKNEIYKEGTKDNAVFLTTTVKLEF